MLESSVNHTVGFLGLRMVLQVLIPVQATLVSGSAEFEYDYEAGHRIRCTVLVKRDLDGMKIKRGLGFTCTVQRDTKHHSVWHLGPTPGPDINKAAGNAVRSCSYASPCSTTSSRPSRRTRKQLASASPGT